mmetsp:Transcript_47490/g.99321  ORF Transcript_47490/g.99321 Transcript_47490/m.99321 type:complete len:423 (-) Transcript_47490:276-1544(-)|eukprot:CAMPEP_0172167198 /NCGR_PEP_ID=MMETSP1050-20130122/9437_1 /TAXON_ID=233186 /ORGANISM="Cryptomonas curvata, Strain CCAP979/52" /LENGTH=422 /DNA_ID=CAMNT_0012837959 /DNA_START=44 /DNA_END=1312 /DNA_ORIENTATION=+
MQSLLIIALFCKLALCQGCVLPKPEKLLTWQFSTGDHPEDEILVHGGALKALGAIKGDISVVSIAGPHRTGKSMLMNRLAPHKIGENPFQVNKNVKDSSNSVIMAVVPPCASGSKNTVVLIDTPGLFAPQRPAKFDAELLAIVNLLSSVVLYNNMGTIERSSVERLSFAVDTAFALSLAEQRDDPAAAEGAGGRISPPHLLWLVQNFHLQMASAERGNMSPQQWLSDVLTQMDKSYNRTSHFESQFHSFFKSIDAFTLPWPVSQLEDIHRLGELDQSMITEGYRAAVATLTERVKTLSEPKSIGAVAIPGSTLIKLIVRWTARINAASKHGKVSDAAQDLLGHIVGNDADAQKAFNTYLARELWGQEESSGGSIFSLGSPSSWLGSFAALACVAGLVWMASKSRRPTSKGQDIESNGGNKSN